MDRYIGIDVHSQSCTCAVMSATGKRLQCDVVETNGEALLDFIHRVRGELHVCIEEVEQSAWLYELLEPRVAEFLVVVPDHPGGRLRNKSDNRDAWSLADQLRLRTYASRVFKAPKAFTELREAVCAHRLLQQDLVRVKNRLKAVFRSRGVSVSGADVYDPDHHADWLAKLPVHRRRVAELLGQELDALAPLTKQAERKVLEEAHRHACIARLQTVPGIGPMRAAQIVAIVVSPYRFRSKRQFWSYCGLGVVTHSSADWVRKGGQWVRGNVTQTRGLNHNRHPILKAVFKGAALSVITLAPTDDPLRQAYERLLAAGTKPNLAKLTLARKLAAIVLAIWKHEEAYDIEKAESHSLSAA